MTHPNGHPLSLAVSARKPRVRAGEGVLLDLHHRVTTPLDMETVELNNNLTTLYVTALDRAGSPTTALTGTDHGRLHRVSLFQSLGRAFRARAGDAWTNYLEVLNFARPLPVGRYRFQVSYRYGDGPRAVVESNVVEVAVDPAESVTASQRWFGGADPREVLGSVWRCRDAGGARWFYQVAEPFDPSVVRVATDLEMPAVSPAADPVLAHINGIADFQFHRYAVWPREGGIGWQRLHAYGRLGDPVDLDLPLAGTPALAEPPLQRADEGLSLVVVGEDAGPAAMVVDVSADGQTRTRALRLGAKPQGDAYVVWGEESPQPRGILYWAARLAADGRLQWWRTDLASGETRAVLETEGVPVALAGDQWLGAGRALLAVQQDQRLTVHAHDAAAGWSEAATLVTHDLATPHGQPLTGPVDVAAAAGGSDLLLLYRSPRAWTVLSAQGPGVLSFDHLPASAATRLVATPEDGPRLLVHEAREGFVAHALAAPSDGSI